MSAGNAAPSWRQVAEEAIAVAKTAHADGVRAAAALPPTDLAAMARALVRGTKEHMLREGSATVSVVKMPSPSPWDLVVQRDEVTGYMTGARLQPLTPADGRRDEFAELVAMVGELAQEVAALRAEVRGKRAAPKRSTGAAAQSALDLN